MAKEQKDKSRKASDGRRTPNGDRRYASDYYYNYNQPAWTERDEEWYRHTYGLPASGRIGQRRHDIAEWGNPSFTQNRTNKQYDRMNDHHSDFQNDREQNAADHYDRNDSDYNRGYGREYNYNRFGMGDQRGTWNQRGDESYNWGDNHRLDEHAKHRGKGPKGYARTDERIHDDIASRLTDDPYVDASDIEVTVDKGEVTLSGTVPDRSSKRRAEDIAELVSGVNNVENRLRVKK